MKKPPKDTQSKQHYDSIDEAAEETFPSSDPPSWTLGSQQEVNAFTSTAMNDIAQILYQEHQAIRRVSGAIAKMIISAEQGNRINAVALGRLSEFLHFFVGQCHYLKEEVLFPTLAQVENGPSDYLLHDLVNEHEHGRKLFFSIEHDGQRYVHGDDSMQDNLIQLLKELQNLFLNHITKEEEYILPLINKILDKKVRDILIFEFKRIEMQPNARTQEQLQKLVDKLYEEINS